MASAISLLHSSRNLMWMDCTTAGQTVRCHVIFICLVHLRLNCSDRLIIINGTLFGLRDPLTSLQSQFNVDGLYCHRTDCTVSCSLYLPRTSAFGFFGSTDKNKLTTFGLCDLLTSLRLTLNSKTRGKHGLLNNESI